MKKFLISLGVSSSLFSAPLDINKLQYDHIEGTNPEEITAYIKEFPFSEYSIATVNGIAGVGYYLIDILDCIKANLKAGNPWEAHIENYIKTYARSGSTVIDVGAHIGTHTLTMSRCVGNRGNVVAFEPQPKSFRELFVNMGMNGASNIRFFWGAAGESEKEIEIPPINASNEGATGIGYGDTGKFVKLISIDSLHLTNVSLIKIDVEGTEDMVLAGARQTILSYKPVLLVEICGGWVYEKQPPELKAIIDQRIRDIRNLGYKVIRIDQWDYLALPI